MNDPSLPEVITFDGSKAEEVWVRINAFLTMKAKNTQRTYQGIIKEWCQFLGAEAGTEEAAQKIIAAQDIHAMAYRAWLEKRPGQSPRLASGGRLSKERSLAAHRPTHERRDGLQHTLTDSTVRKKFAALRRLYRLLMAAEVGVRSNPFDTDKVPTPRAESGQKRPTEMIDYAKVPELLALPDTNTYKGLRDRALLAVLFGGGLRRSEVVHLRLDDVRKTKNKRTFLLLRSTKAKTDAHQALPDWAAAPLREYLSRRLEEGAGPADFLFISFRGKGGRVPTDKKLSTNGLYRIFRRYCLEAGVSVFASPHSARATAITKLLDQGLPHRDVREFSRHASVQMVEAYDKRRRSVDESPAHILDYGSD